MPAYVKLAGTKTAVKDLPPVVAALVQGALGEEPAQTVVPTLWPDPCDGEDVLYLSNRRLWYHRCALCGLLRFVPLWAPARHRPRCPNAGRF